MSSSRRWHVKAKPKYNAKPTEVDGIRFDSRKEARYYNNLVLRQKANEVLFFLRQVPFHLPGKATYRVDFMEFHSDGSVHFVDVKGVKTKDFILKKKLVESLYPVEIEIA